MEQWQRIGEWFTTFTGQDGTFSYYGYTWYIYPNSETDSPILDLGYRISSGGNLATDGSLVYFANDGSGTGKNVNTTVFNLKGGYVENFLPKKIKFKARLINFPNTGTSLQVFFSTKFSGSPRRLFLQNAIYNSSLYPHFAFVQPDGSVISYPCPSKFVNGTDWTQFELTEYRKDGDNTLYWTLAIDGLTVASDFVAADSSSLAPSSYNQTQTLFGTTSASTSGGNMAISPNYLQFADVEVWRVITVSPEPPTVYITKSGSGPVTLTAHAGVDPNITQTVSYSWSTGDTTAAIQVDRPGIYTCTVTDSEGQSVTGAYFLLNEADFITSYLWSTGETTPSISVNSSGTYTVTATNAAGLSSTASITVRVTQPALPYPLQSSYSQEHTPSIVRTHMLDKHARQRTLAGKPPRTVSCKYQLTQSQFDYWLETWRTTLKEGAEWFKTWLLGDDNVLEQKTVRLRNGEWSYSLIHHTDAGNLYELTMKFDVKEA